MRRFVLFLYGFTALTQVSFVVFVHAVLSPLGATPALVLAALLGAGSVALLHHRMRLAFDDRPVSAARTFLERAYYAHWSGGIGGLVLFPLAFFVSLGGVDLFPFCYPVGLAFAAYGVFYRARTCRVQTYEIPIPGLGDGFDGYRIAQLSDIHVGSHLPPAAVRPWVDQVNELEVDLVALTGDYVTSGARFHRAAAAELARLRARDGVFAVMGNHDGWDGGEPIRSSFRELGIVLLENQARVLERDAHRLGVIGIDDVYARRDDVDAAVRDVDASGPLIALAHDPRLFDALAKRGVDFVMSGHTHWGQVALPFAASRFNFMRFAHRHASGMCVEAASRMYVHPGCGTTGVPIRLGVAPEITVFVLRPA